MREIGLARDVRTASREARCSGLSVGLVPTMGYLHAGHAALIGRARQENDLVIVSIFVNPTQFGPAEDLDRYPRDLDHDRAVAEAEGADLLFVPGVQEMYPGGPSAQTVWVEPGALAANLCGASRPGHFRGVATVVTKLFNMTEPDRAYFGQKDIQQAVIIQRMVADLDMPVRIVISPTVREDDGLALSSRNVYLTPDERGQAVALSGALAAAKAAIVEGQRSGPALEALMTAVIARVAPEARIDYAAVASYETLQPLDVITGDAILALAAYLGETRLIDNVIVHSSDSGVTFS